ncbi:MAG: hypothetical protein WC272_06115 [Sulfurimonas sp.]|jgi:hypothetical protein
MEWYIYIIYGFVALVIIKAIFGNNGYSDDCDDMFDPDCYDYWLYGPGSWGEDDKPYDDTWNSSDDLYKDDDKY